VTEELRTDGPASIERLLFRQHRVLSRRQAVAVLGRPAVNARIRNGAWQSPCRSVVVAHNGLLTRRQQLWVAVLHGGPGAVCGGPTAAALLGLRGPESPDVHVVIPAQRQVVPIDGVHIHRATVLPSAHVLDQALPPLTTMARAVADAAAWAPSDADAREFVVAAVRQGKVLPSEVADVLKVLPRSKRRSLVLETVDLAVNGAAALADDLLVKTCRRDGLPVPDRQVRRADATGRPRYLDAYWSRWQLRIEVDTAQQRDGPAAIPGWALFHKQPELAALIRAALIDKGWRG
jgi:hypothetical protein